MNSLTVRNINLWSILRNLIQSSYSIVNSVHCKTPQATGQNDNNSVSACTFRVNTKSYHTASQSAATVPEKNQLPPTTHPLKSAHSLCLLIYQIVLRQQPVET